MTLLHTLIHPSRLHDIKFCRRVGGTGEVLLAAGEDKKLSIYDIPPEKERPPRIIAEMIGHSNRYLLAVGPMLTSHHTKTELRQLIRSEYLCRH